MKLIPAAVLLLAGALLADDIHQRMKRSEAEAALRRLIVIGEMQNRVNSACISSLDSCRTLADDLTMEGMRTLPTRLNVKTVKPSNSLWREARADALGYSWP